MSVRVTMGASLTWWSALLSSRGAEGRQWYPASGVGTLMRLWRPGTIPSLLNILLFYFIISSVSV